LVEPIGMMLSGGAVVRFERTLQVKPGIVRASFRAARFGEAISLPAQKKHHASRAKRRLLFEDTRRGKDLVMDPFVGIGE